jgi:hypothetical protein
MAAQSRCGEHGRYLQAHTHRCVTGTTLPVWLPPGGRVRWLRGPSLWVRRRLCGEVPLLAGGSPQLDDPPGSRNRQQEYPEYGGEEQRDTQREMPMSTQEADLNALVVLQDEDEQQNQDQREEDGGYPGLADPRPLDRSAWHRHRSITRLLGRWRGIGAGLSATCWL